MKAYLSPEPSEDDQILSAVNSFIDGIQGLCNIINIFNDESLAGIYDTVFQAHQQEMDLKEREKKMHIMRLLQNIRPLWAYAHSRGSVIKMMQMLGRDPKSEHEATLLYQQYLKAIGFTPERPENKVFKP